MSYRAMTRKEVRVLKNKGLHPAKLTPDNSDDALDAILETVLSKDDLEALEDMPNHCALTVYRKILQETFGIVPKEEEKN
ncbi:MAG: hypothetical protein JRJ54_14320 [Deltaproteobacteria bacterium]|nr:hypothetical protein [Deltaproteobacteria bacterium]